MPQFALLIYGDDSWTTESPEREAEVMQEYGAFSERHQDVIRGGVELDVEAPSQRVAVRGGERVLHDGPFAETREMLGGFFLVETPDLETAVAIGAEIPDAFRATIHVVPCTENAVEEPAS